MRAVPIRSCIVCGGKQAKRQMLRLVHKASTAEITLDIEQIADGRGRYICSSECAEKLRDVKILRRAFRMNLVLERAEVLLKALEGYKWS